LIRDKLGVASYSPSVHALLAKEVDFLLSRQMRLKDILSVLLGIPRTSWWGFATGL
jgi:hypothetical protein